MDCVDLLEVFCIFLVLQQALRNIYPELRKP